MEIIRNLYCILMKKKKSLLKKNRKCRYTKNNIVILLFFIIVLILQIDISKEKIIFLRKFNLVSEIIMTFNGIGEQKIISDYYQYFPDEIYANGNLINREGNIIKDLTTNTITMKWNHLLNTTNFMFAELSNIIGIDLSNFDTSLVTDMNVMFVNCYSLTSLNLSNFKTSSVTKMNSMFYNCYSLRSLDLSSFNTSLVTNINGMFYNCSLLTSLDLSNFNTSLITNMDGLFHNCASLKSLNVKSFNTSSVKSMYLTFYNCSSLTSLDVSNFDTSLVDDMQGTFGQCQSLISLNLSNFKTSKVNNMEGMFGGSYSLLSLDLSNFDISYVTNMLGMFFECKSLVFLNMNSSKEINSQSQTVNIENMFKTINPNIKLCINRENNQNIYQALISTNLNNNNNCNDICFNDFIKIDVNEKKCTEECEINKYEYNNLCFESCPENTHISPNNNHTCEEDLNCEKLNKYYNYEKTSCINNIPEGYFINNESLKTIDKCHIDCKTCEEKYNENNSNCKTCLNDKILDLGNCVSSCINDFFIDSSGNKICKCSYNSKCYECSNESNELELCISCNDGYYQKSDEESNEKGFINCYKDPDGYYLDKDIYKPCSQNCKNCTNSEDINNNKCLECYSDYLLENGQCYEICQYYYYFDSSNQYHCSDYDRCPFEYSKLIKEKKKCISNCIDDDIYKHEIDNICYKSNPEETTLSYLSDNPNEIDNSVITNISIETDKTDISDIPIETNKTDISDIPIEADKTDISDISIETDKPDISNISIETDKTDISDIPIETNKTDISDIPIEADKTDISDIPIESDKTDITNTPNESDKTDKTNTPNESDKTDITNIPNESDKTDITNIPNESDKTDKTNIPNESDKTDKTNIPNESDISNISNIPDESDKTDITNTPNESDISNISNIPDETNKSDTSNIPDETDKSDISNIPIETDKSNIINIPIETEIANYNINKIECPDNNPYQNKNKECIKQCNATDFFNEICKINNNNPKTLDNMIVTIKNQLSNGTLDLLLSNVINGEKNDLLVVSNNINYQITTTDNQNNNNYTNISTIKLGDCEDILKEKYKIDKNKTLLILKIDYYMEGLYIPVINYEVYNPDTKEKLDLNYCKETFIDLDIPVSIDENNLFKYDPNSDYYTDDCYPYTTDNGTDIILNDRKEEFIDNNMSLCENKCNYNGYNGESKKASCECEVKSEQSSINEIENSDNILSNNFTFDNSTSNMKTMKCTSTLFSKDGLLKNIASYILIIIIMSFIILTILYFKFGYYLIDKDIKNILYKKEKKKKKMNIFNFNEKKNKNKNKKKRKIINKIKLGNPLKKKKKKINQKTNDSKRNQKFNIRSTSKIELKNTNILINIEKKNNILQDCKTNKSRKTNTNNLNFIKFDKFYESEMNYFPYKMALQLDKRTYLNYYISLLKIKHPLIFPFIAYKDYNLVIIKISILLLSYAIYFGINTLFFNTLTIHKIYEDQGNYNLQYHINPIICSFFISHFICCIIKYISLSERNLLKIKYQITYEKANLMADEVRKCIFIKYICFYVSSLVFLIFFWYYLSSFCAIFQNSQLFLFINTTISCGISLIYPFIFNIFPGIFRILSLDKNRNSEYMYIISQVIQFL